MTATIAVVMYSKELRQLILVTLEGQCEVWNDFPSTLRHRGVESVENSESPNKKAFFRVSGGSLNKANHNNIDIKQQGNSNLTTCYLPKSQKPSSVFHVPSNCMCGDISVEDGVNRLFLGSYDCHLYVYDLCLGTCEISIFMHHAVTSLKCFVLPFGVDQLTDLFPSLENANSSIEESENKVPGWTTTRGRDNALRFQSSFHSDGNMDAVQLLDNPRCISIPLLFVATMQNLVLFPSSPSMLQSWQDKKNESSKPLVLADESLMRGSFYEWCNPHQHHESAASGTIYRGEPGMSLKGESHRESKHIGGRESNSGGRDGRASMRSHVWPMRVSQPQKCTSSLHYPTITSAISLDFSQPTHASGHTDSTKEGIGGRISGKNFKDTEVFAKALPIDATPSIAIVYPLWIVTIRWHSLDAPSSLGAEALFDVPSHSQQGQPCGGNFEAMTQIQSMGLLRSPEHGNKSKCSLTDEDSFLSLSSSSTLSYVSSSSSSNDVIELSRLSNSDASGTYDREGRFYSDGPSLTMDHQFPAMSHHQQTSSENQLPHAIPRSPVSTKIENATLLLRQDTGIRSSFQDSSTRTACSPDLPLSSSCMIRNLMKKEVEASSSSSAAVGTPKERVKLSGIAGCHTNVPSGTSAKPSRLRYRKPLECAHSPVFVDVSVDGGSVVLVASRENGHVFVLRLTRNQAKINQITTGGAEQNSIDLTNTLPLLYTGKNDPKLGNPSDLSYHNQSLTSLELKPSECQPPRQSTTSRTPFPCNKVRIPLSLGKRTKIDASVGTAAQVHRMPSISATQSDFKFSNTSLAGYASKTPSFAVGDDLIAHSLVGVQRGNQSLHVELTAGAGLSNIVAPQELGADVDIMLHVECLWTGILEGPLVERISIFHKGRDAIRVALMSAAGKCYIINPTTSIAAEYSLSEGCSSFVLTKEPLPGALDENSPAMGTPLAASSGSSQYGVFLPEFVNTTSVPVFTKPSVFIKKNACGLYDTVECGAGTQGGQCNNRTLSCCTPGFVIRVICVNVEELCVYSTNEICWDSMHNHLLQPLSKRSPRASSPGRRDEHRTTDEAPSNLPKQNLPFVQHNPLNLFSHHSSGPDDFEDALHRNSKAERDLLLELGIALQTLEAQHEKSEQNENIEQIKSKDPEDLIFYARQILTKGYSAKDWMLLKSMERSLPHRDA